MRHLSVSNFSACILSVFLTIFFMEDLSAQKLGSKNGLKLKVGVFNNPPVTLKEEDGTWSGIAVDVLNEVADKYGWEVEYVGGTFAAHQAALKKNQIDIITPIAYSKERSRIYTYNKISLISNWGLVYSKPESHVKTILDLEGKRISVMKQNIHAKAFSELMNKFSIEFVMVNTPGFAPAMEAVKKNRADAVVSNRLFGALNAEKYGLVETGIVFNPINIHYAAGHEGLIPVLTLLDAELSRMKLDKGSVYYSSMQKWMHDTGKTRIPDWVYWTAYALIGGFILISAAALLLRYQVAVKTRELRMEIEERKLAQAKLDRMAYFDSLTGLPNRISFFDSLKMAIGNAKRTGTKTAVFFIDLDRFKTINDSLGHTSGDQILIEVAKRLEGCLRDGDSINRFGGDEFVAVLPDIKDPSDVDPVATRMLESMNAPIIVGPAEFYSTLSIGISIYPDDDSEIDGLLKSADTAMYHAKDRGGNSYFFHNVEFTNRVRSRLELETKLRIAIQRSEFEMHYQPICDLKTGKIISAEALIRWNHPEMGMVYPDSFIPLAEENGMIVPIGEWVIEQVCRQMHEWDKKGLPSIQTALNISSSQFSDKNFIQKTASIMEKNATHPSRLDMEITERMFVNLDSSVMEVLNLLKEIGITLSIDDFGTGYSSLKYLKELPIDTLKIDRSFVSGIPDDKEDIQISSAIILMAQKLGLDVIAEGIETEMQKEFLLSQGCSTGQGYYYSKPVNAHEFERLFLDSQ